MSIHEPLHTEWYTVHGMLKMSFLICNAQYQVGKPSDIHATSVRVREQC
jgi:hypothetical protein